MSGPLGSSQWMYTTEEYEIQKSVRLIKDDASYFGFTPGSAGNRRTWTYSAWIKLGKLSIQRSFLSATGSEYTDLRINSDDKLEFYIDDTQSTATKLFTTPLLRDPAAWYHIVIAFDTTQGTEANRVKLYINGQQQSAFDAAVYPSQNYEGTINNNVLHAIGRREQGDGHPYDGYLSEVHFIDGTALSAASFGSTGAYGEWKPKKYGGSYGTNGFFFEFKQTGTSQNSSGIGADTSGNDNHWTVNNIASHDVMLDNPTNNFSVMASNGYQGADAFRDGGLFIRDSGTVLGLSTIRPTSGKWYWEVDLDGRYSGSPYWGALFSPADEDGDSNDYDAVSEANVKIVSYSGGSNFITIEGGTLNASHGTWPADHIWGFAYDVDAGKLWISKNGDFTAVGVSGSNPSTATNPAATGLGSHCIPAFGPIGSTSTQFNAFLRANFGADGTFAGAQTSGGESDDNGYGDFKYDVPSGFLSICTKNLPEPAVKPVKNFNEVLYTGDGNDDRSISVGFQPDIVWIKSLSNATNHYWYDSIRGANYQLLPNDNAAEANTADRMQAFESNGFQLGTSDEVNGSSRTYIAWNWKMPTTFSNNTNGSITSSGRVNSDAGMSIVSYTGNQTAGATVGHGLSKAPEWILIKGRGNTGGWLMGHIDITFNNSLVFNTTAANNDETEIFNDTAPSSTVFTLGSDTFGNKSGTMMAYCFHSVEGFSRFGKYNGNGSADGSFIYTGFSPMMVMAKSTARTEWLRVYDSKRNPDNPADDTIESNSGAEQTGAGVDIDILSNGFKLRSSDSGVNANGEDWIYMAFAEVPLKYANAR